MTVSDSLARGLRDLTVAGMHPDDLARRLGLDPAYLHHLFTPRWRCRPPRGRATVPGRGGWTQVLKQARDVVGCNRRNGMIPP